MTLTKQFDGQALLSALKISSLADAPKMVSAFFSILLSWTAASIALLASTSPVLGFIGGFIPTLVGLAQQAINPILAGVNIQISALTLSKAWDVQALLKALEAAEIPAAEGLLVDDVGVFFDWLGSSFAMGNALEQKFQPIITDLFNLIDGELKSFLPPAA